MGGLLYRGILHLVQTTGHGLFGSYVLICKKNGVNTVFTLNIRTPFLFKCAGSSEKCLRTCAACVNSDQSEHVQSMFRVFSSEKSL